MFQQLDIFADVALSFNGEDIVIHGEGDRILVGTPTVASGARFLYRMLRQREWMEWLEELDSKLKAFGLSLYFQIGKMSLPLLGVKGKRRYLSSLQQLNSWERRYKAFSRLPLD